MSLRKVIVLGICIFAGVIGVKVFKKNVDKESLIALIPKEKNSPAERSDLLPLAGGESCDEKDMIERLFTTEGDKLPIVETISYKSRVPWLKGRPAWIADYASHFSTSRHFIARSLNQEADYYTQKVSSGDRFNILNPNKNFNFYLLVDINKLKMWFYYVDLDQAEKVLIKTYKVGLGAIEGGESTTPVGSFWIGDRVATYKPGMVGLFRNEKVEMINVFGTRWIPFNQTDEVAGYGIHGLPCEIDPANQEFIEHTEMLGKYSSDGCIRLGKEDIEELYSIVISRPTLVEITQSSDEITENPKNIPEALVASSQ